MAERIGRNILLVYRCEFFQHTDALTYLGNVFELLKLIEQVAAVCGELIRHEGIHIVIGTVLIRHNVLVFACFYAVEQIHSLAQSALAEVLVSYHAAHKTNL